MDIAIEFDQVTLGRLAMRIGHIPDAMGEGLLDMAKTVKLALQGRTPVASGRAKRSWLPPALSQSGESIEVSIGNPTPYMPSLDEGEPIGGRWGMGYGPRTTRAYDQEGNLRVYSRQAPGGIVHPTMAALNIDRMAAQIASRVVETLNA